jgi:hypothetical protein
VFFRADAFHEIIKAIYRKASFFLQKKIGVLKTQIGLIILK